MRFDKTFIAIRERSVLEILDLSLHVVRDHFRPLSILLVVGVVPWMILDWILCGFLLEDIESVGLYYWIMTLLVISQAQVGTSFVTHYLGQAMFVGRPHAWTIIKDSFRTSMFFIWVHGGIRMVVPTALFCLMLDTYFTDTSISAFVFFIPASVGIGLLVRGFRPFVSEILMLEKTPISKNNKENQINFSTRSSSLHGQASSDLFGRLMTIGLIAIPLTASLCGLFIVTDSISNVRANSETSFIPYYYAVSLWIVAGYLAVVRFLSYIDTRIRQEGWAVELRLRAEGFRLAEAME